MAMNRGQMRAMLKRRLADQADTRWPNNSDWDDELNAAAQYVGAQIAIWQRINYLSGYVAFTADSTSFFILPPEFAHIWAMCESTSVNLGVGVIAPCVQIDERELGHKADTDGRNDVRTGSVRHRMFYVVWNAELLPQAQIGFVGPAPTGLIFQVRFSRLLNTIPSGSATSDTEVYRLPGQHHELIVVRAALQLIGADETQWNFLANTWNDLYGKLLADIGYMPDSYSYRFVPKGAKPAFLSPVTSMTRKPESFGAPGAAEQ